MSAPAEPDRSPDQTPDRRLKRGSDVSADLSLDDARGRWVLLATVLGSGVAMLDATVVSIALPTIGRDLGGGLAGLQWIVTGYTLTLAAFILLGGSLGDLLGRRRVFVVGAVWFGVASLLCALAPSIWVLVAARALQGIGGALMTPGSLAILSASFAPRDRARAIGAWSGLGGVAGAIGPFVGGYLLDVLSWRWLFLINVPLIAVVVLVAQRYVPETRDSGADPRLDVAGAVTGAVGLAAVTYGLVALGGSGSRLPALVALGAGIVILAAFVVVEQRSAHPMVALEIFASRMFTAVNVVTLLIYAALSGVFFLLALQLQVVAGFSPLVAGALILPVTVLMLLGSARVGAAAGRYGARVFMTAGPLVAAAGLLIALPIGRGSTWVPVLASMSVFGVGLTLTVAPLTAAVLGAASTRYAGLASGINNAVARTAGLLAVASLPRAAGLADDAISRPAALDAGYERTVVICVLLLVAAAILAALTTGEKQSSAAPPEAGAALDVPTVSS